MSCCGGNCGCGSSCKCGNGCGGCGMYPDLNYSEASAAATTTRVLGFQKTSFEVAAGEMEAAENGCKCGANCDCTTCSCCQ